MNETLKVLFEQISNIQFFTLNETTFNHLACAKTTAFEDFEYTRNILLKNIKKAVDKERFFFALKQTQFYMLKIDDYLYISRKYMEQIMIDVNNLLDEFSLEKISNSYISYISKNNTIIFNEFYLFRKSKILEWESFFKGDYNE